MGIILRLDWFRSDTMWLIEKFGLYLSSMEKAIAAGREEDRERINRIDINSEYDFDDQKEELHRHKLLFEKAFPSQLRYSFLVMSYILFESRSKALGEELKERKIVVGKALKQKPGESFPQSVQRFFEAEPNSLTFIKAATWTELSDLNELRNCIVHRSGEVDSTTKGDRVRQIIRENKAKGLSLDGDGVLHVELGYCRHVVEIIKQFFHRVFEETHFGPEE